MTQKEAPHTSTYLGHAQPLIGQLLIKKNLITEKQLQSALHKQKETGQVIGAVLLDQKYLKDESDLLHVLAEQLRVEYVKIKGTLVPQEALQIIPAQFATHYKIIPIRIAKGSLTVATHRPTDIHLLDELGLIVTHQIKTVLAGEEDILEGIRTYYGVGAETIEKMMDKTDSVRSIEEEIDNIEESGEEASISKFLNQILLEAYKDDATDIHIEPFADALHVRYRIDGMLYDAKVPRNIWHFKDAISSRVKILSNLNIAEKRMPQDGRFKVRVGSVDLDLRVSFLPTPCGESIVLRILNTTRLYKLDELGLPDKERSLLKELITKPHGIIFLTGPTGSGKTTTLYSCLSKMNTDAHKIITIEDPIEYQLKGITQIQINPAIGLTFAKGLRSMLRHDPDIMMVGEVRDLETATTAVQVALTGHLIFSTLHTNDAASGITRLMDMGIEPFLITSTVQCFIAQRLVRTLCDACKSPADITAEMVRMFGHDELAGYDGVIFEHKGCDACHGTGYRGRQAIYEFLVLNDEFRRLIIRREEAHILKEKATGSGMRTLRQAGWEKVKQGTTTLQEVIRVTQEGA